MKPAKLICLVLFSFFSFGHLALGTTKSIALNSQSQTVSLGLYGDQSITEIHLFCAASASTYYWTIGGGWQTPDGETSVATSISSLTIVPVPGWIGCGGGNASVSGIGITGGGGGISPLGKSNESKGTRGSSGSFEFNASFYYLNPYITPPATIPGYGSTPSSITCQVVNVISSLPGSNYTWSIGSGSSFLTPASTTSPSCTVYIGLPPSSAFVSTIIQNEWIAQGSVTVTITIPNSPQCTVTAKNYIQIDGGPIAGPAPDPNSDGCSKLKCYSISYDEDDDSSIEEIECAVCSAQQQRIGRGVNKIYPNPITRELTIELNEAASGTTISLFNQNGDLLGTKENVNDKINWDTSTLPAGIYFIRINNGTETLSERLIKKN